MSPDVPVRFSAVVEPMPWGRNVYTVVKVPDELATAARRESTRRVEGSIAGCEVNVGLNRADVVPESFIYVGRGLQQRLGVHAGDLVECVLAPADPDEVLVPDDVRDALEAAGKRDLFESRPAPERRRLLVPVEGAARPATRERRIAALVASLPDG
jgi:hypothetical protein